MHEVPLYGAVCVMWCNGVIRAYFGAVLPTFVSQVYAGLSAAQIIDRVANQGLRPKAPRGERAHPVNLAGPFQPTMWLYMRVVLGIPNHYLTPPSPPPLLIPAPMFRESPAATTWGVYHM